MKMMSYCVLASICLLSSATAQTVMQLTGCLTKENNLKMDCSFTPAAGSSPPPNCTFKTDGKVVASTDVKAVQDSTFKNRATVTIVNQVCHLNLTGLADDKPKNYSCTIMQTGSGTMSTSVDKNLPTCSAWSVLQQRGAALLLALLTFPLFSELLQQKSPDPEVDVPIIEEDSVGAADDPSAIAAIQSAATFSTDQPIKYFFKTEGRTGPVTYRVIHLADGQVDAQADGTAAVSVVAGFPAATQAGTPAVTQAVFSQADGLEGEGTETHYYYPATIADTAPATMVTNVHASDSLLSQPATTGQLYVMMSPQDVLGTSHQSKTEAPRTSRDDKRRAQHNEVERRRRDKINNWIVQLSKTIPDCTVDTTKNSQSKGGILSKACDYIQELRQSNAQLGKGLESLERQRMDNHLLRQEVEEWKSKNQMLRARLRQHGIVAASNLDAQ
ncbi:hypothetical protein P4O66_016279 [Electrophorus voltai]|uniref:Upstream stimulatory factor 1 n=1 Tax=Electrophorus voltai TaxID=2609070 RepID=A0AAD8YVP0_9TELE|nr:hypothetical protein P4O66_016279 [Electrophorus voltai]